MTLLKALVLCFVFLIVTLYYMDGQRFDSEHGLSYRMTHYVVSGLLG